jgi:hypothetical protein
MDDEQEIDSVGMGQPGVTMMKYSKMLWYLAAPLTPIAGECMAENRIKAIEMAQLLVMRDWSISAPWLWSACNQEGGSYISRAVANNFACLERCDAIVCVGPRISAGMREEVEFAQQRGIRVVYALNLDAAGVDRVMKASLKI